MWIFFEVGVGYLERAQFLLNNLRVNYSRTQTDLESFNVVGQLEAAIEIQQRGKGKVGWILREFKSLLILYKKLIKLQGKLLLHFFWAIRPFYKWKTSTTIVHRGFVQLILCQQKLMLRKAATTNNNWKKRKQKAPTWWMWSEDVHTLESPNNLNISVFQLKYDKTRFRAWKRESRLLPFHNPNTRLIYCVENTVSIN